MPNCFVCQSAAERSTLFAGRVVPACEACVTRAVAQAPAECPTCGRSSKRTHLGRPKRPEAERFAIHDQRVLDAVTPDASWRTIVRVSKLSVSDAMRARERLIAAGRLELRCDATGARGARYDVHGRKLPGVAYQPTTALLPPVKP